MDMPYRILPGVSFKTAVAMFRMNKPPAFGRIFEIAFIRAMGAGAFDVTWRMSDIRESLYVRNHSSGDTSFLGHKDPQPLPLRSFAVLFLAWCLGCISSFVSFVFEVCSHCNVEISSSPLPFKTDRITYRRHHS